MANYQNSILIGVKLQDINTMKSNLQTELDKIKGLKSTISKVGLDTNVIKNDIQTQLNGLNFTINIGKVDTSGIDTAINKTKQATQEAQQFKNVMGKSLNIGDGAKAFDDLQRRANEIRNTVDSLAKINFNTTKNGGVKDATITYTDNMGKLVTETMKWKQVMSESDGVVKNVFTTTNVRVSDNIQQLGKLEAKIESIKSKMQGSLSNANTNGFINASALNDLQTKLNAINTKTPASEILKLQNTINGLTHSEMNIVELKNTINNMSQALNNIKSGTNSDILGLTNVKGQILAYESQLSHLKVIMNDAMSGKNVDMNKVIDEINTMNFASKQLTSSLQNAKTQADGLSVSLRNSLQSKLTTSFNNGFINTTTLTDLQNKLNSINARTPRNEINSVVNSINSLGSSEGNINKLQNAINTLATRINSIKSSKAEIISSNNITELRTAENEVKKLQQLLSQVKSGKIIDGKAISAEVNTARNSVNQLSSAVNSVRTNASSLGSIFKSVFSYAVGGSLIYAGINQIRQGLKDIKDIDTAMRDLIRVSDDVSESVLSGFATKANAMGIALGRTTEDAITATATFKQLGYTFEEASQYMAKNSLVLSNVGDMSAKDSSNAIVSVLKGFRLEAKDTTAVVDSLNEAGNRYAITTGELASGLRLSSAALALANNNLQQSEALIVAGTEVLRNPEEIGTGLKTISMRLNQVKTVGGETFFKLKGDLKNIANTELTDMNGNLRSTYDVILDISKAWESGKLSDMDKSKLLDEVAGKQQAKVLSSIIQNASQLPKIYETMKNSAGSASQEQARYMDSIEGRLNAFKETVKSVWTNSIESSSLKNLLSGATSIIGVLNKMVTSFGAMPTVIGLAVTSMTMFNTRFRESQTMFTNMIPGINSLNVRLATWTTRLNTTTLALQRMILYQKEKIATAQADGASTTAMGVKLSELNVKLAMTQAQLIATKVASIALQTALSIGSMVAIGAIITLGDNIINASSKLKEFNDEYVSTMKSGEGSPKQGQQLIDQYESLKTQLSTVKQGTDEYKEKEQQLANVQDQLIQLYPQANDVIDKNTGKKLLNLQATKDLVDQEGKLSQDKARKVLEKNGVNYSTDITQQVEEYKKVKSEYDMLMEKYNKGEQFYTNERTGQDVNIAHELDRVGEDFDSSKSKMEAYYSALSVFGKENEKWGDSLDVVGNALGRTGENATSAQGKIQIVSKAINELDVKKIIPDSTINSLKKAFPDLSIDASNATQKVSEFKNELSKSSGLFAQSQKELTNTGSLSESTVKKLSEAFPDLGINSKNAKESVDSLKDSLDTLNGTDADAHAKEMAKATNEYQKSTQAIAKAQGFIDKLNKAQAVTPQLAGQIAKKYADVGTSINNLGSTIDFLKGKIKEQQEAQENALMVEKGDDADFYKEKVANNEDYEKQINGFLARFTGNSKGAYDVDLSQFTTLNQMKAGVQGTLKSAVDGFLSQFVDTSSSAYNVDYSNFTNLINAKKEILKQMAGSMATFWDETSNSFNGQAYGGMDLSGHASDSMYKAYEDKAKGVLGLGDKIRTAMKGLDGIYAKGGLDFKGFDGGGGTSDFSGTGKDSGKSKADSDANKAEKLAEDIARLKSEIEPDRYLDFNNAVKQVDNELNLNKSIKDNLKKDSPEYQSALEKDIKLYKDKQIALNNLNKEQKKELEEKRIKLTNLGFEFEANGKLINSQKTLLEIQEKVNAMGGNTEEDKQAKEDAIKNLKQINDETKDYISLFGDKIPKTTEEWEEQANAIAKVNDEMKETLSNFRDKIAGYELKELQEKQKKADEDLESAEKKKKKALEDAKKAKADELDAQIKALQAQIKALDDESADNEKKLAKLKTERNLWLKDDSAFSKSKIADLDTKIKETEKTIKKDNLNKQIDNLQDKKDASDKKYDKELSDLDESYEKKKDKQKKADDDAKLEEKAYEKADKLLKGNHQNDIIKLMSKYGESYKNVGKLLGENFKDGWIAQIEQAKKEYTDLMGDLNASTSTNNSTSSSSEKSSKEVKVGDSVKVSNSSGSIVDVSNGSATSSNGSWSSHSGENLKTVGYDNGYFKLADDSGNIVGWATRDDIARYADGGRTGNLGSDGKFVIADSNEMIANANDTKKFDEMYNYIKNSGGLVSQLSSQYSNLGNYTMPSLGTDLNSLTNGVTNNTDNSMSQPISISFGDIINHNGAEANMNMDKIVKTVKKSIYEDGRKFR